MLKLNLTGLVFPISYYIGKNNNWDVNFFLNKKKHMNVEQLKELYNNGWEIGSHGDSHKSYRFLSKKEVEYDMRNSKQVLENELNSKVDSFAPPFGYYNSFVLKMCDEIGYKKIFIQKPILDDKVGNNYRVEIVYRRSIYSIDNKRSIKRKTRDSIFEILKENFIHGCSFATTVTKKII
tara:strand:- start:53 stop:589 length:537 start_codon:yes stop_codon:yes gene_type:complete